MAHSEVVDTIEAHVRAAWSRTPIHIEDESRDVSEDGGPFVVLSFPWSRSERASFGSPGANLWREEGAFLLTLALPRGESVRSARAWLDEFASTVRGKGIGEVHCLAPQSPVLDDDRDDTAHVRMMMSVPYLFDLVG